MIGDVSVDEVVAVERTVLRPNLFLVGWTDSSGTFVVQAEVSLAATPSNRLFELNGNEWTIELYGYEHGGRGDRRLAIIRINGRDVGDILIEERLATE